MTATVIASQAPVSINGTIAAGAAALTFTACDNVNGNSTVLTGREMIVVNNTGGTAATITVSSTADALGRTGDITAYSVPAAGFALLGPFPLAGWKQQGSPPTLLYTASAATMKVAVIQLPPSY